MDFSVLAPRNVLNGRYAAPGHLTLGDDERLAVGTLAVIVGTTQHLENLAPTQASGDFGDDAPVEKPDGIEVGDTCIIVGAQLYVGRVMTDDNGATPFTKVHDFDSTDGRLTVWTRVMTGDEPDTFHFLYDAATSRAVIAWRIKGARRLNLFDVTPANGEDGSDASPTAPSATPGVAPVVAFAVAAIHDFASAETFSAGPYGWTHLATENANQPLAIYYRVIEGIGPAGDQTFTISAAKPTGTLQVFTIESAGLILDDVTCGATGTVEDAAITGTAAITLDALALDADGTVLVVGTLTITLDPLTLDADGSALAEIVGLLAQTLDALTLDADGTVAGGAEILGALDRILDALTTDLDGTVLIVGVLTRTLDDLTTDLDGTVAVQGTLARTLDDLTVVSAGTAFFPVFPNRRRGFHQIPIGPTHVRVF